MLMRFLGFANCHSRAPWAISHGRRRRMTLKFFQFITRKHYVTAETLDTRVPLLRWRRRIAHPLPRPAGHKRARALLRIVCAT